MIAAYRARGWATIRIRPASKIPIGKWSTRIDEPGDFAPGDNTGIRLGAPSGGVTDIDLDCPAAVRLAPLYLPLTATFGRTSKPRSHWIYQCEGAQSRKPTHTHVELRSTGLYTVFPSSIHETGEPIEWSPDGVDVTTITEAELLRSFARLCIATVVANVWETIPGERHHGAMVLAGALWHSGWSLDDTLAVLLPAIGLTDTDVMDRETAIRGVWDDTSNPNRFGWPTLAAWKKEASAAMQTAIGYIAAAAPPTLAAVDGIAMTDYGNAERLAMDHGDSLRHVPGVGWLQWCPPTWTIIEYPAPLVIESARKLAATAEELGAVALGKWSVGWEGAARIDTSIRLLKAIPGIETPAIDLDADPWKLCTPTGTIDLRTGRMAEHEPTDLQTMVTGCTYDPDGTPHRFMRFLREIFQNDWDLAACVMRFLGYCLTGETTEQVLQVWHGGGANGKTTLIETLGYVLGDYSQTLSPDLLMSRRFAKDSSSASPDVARLRGVRLSCGEETRQGQRWNESLVKQLTGGGSIVARNLYGKPFSFANQSKLILAVNHRPTVNGTDHGMWRRLQLVTFGARFDAADRDPHLLETLRAEGPQILGMLVQACLAWQEHGLLPPPTMIEAAKGYREDQDVIGSFLREKTKPTGRTPRASLYLAYRQWAMESGEYVHGKHAFYSELRDREFVESKAGNQRYWQGVSL